MADRGVPPPRDPDGHGRQAWLPAARAGGRRGEERDLRYNSARLYKLDLRAELPSIGRDKFATMRHAMLHEPARSNAAYGYVARRG